MRQLINTSIFIISLFLAGCSKNSSSLSQTFELAFFGPESQNITAEKIKELPYASLFVNQNNNPNALLVLAWAENSDNYQQSPIALKWLSANKELVVTQAGRVTKTVNLGGGNITRVTSKSTDPLALNLLLPATPKTWTYTLSWQPGQHNRYVAHSQFKITGHTSLSLTLGEQQVTTVTEQVTIKDLNRTYENYYWLSDKDGHVVKSVQTLAPNLSTLTLTEAKPFEE